MLRATIPTRTVTSAATLAETVAKQTKLPLTLSTRLFSSAKHNQNIKRYIENYKWVEEGEREEALLAKVRSIAASRRPPRKRAPFTVTRPTREPAVFTNDMTSPVQKTPYYPEFDPNDSKEQQVDQEATFSAWRRSDLYGDPGHYNGAGSNDSFGAQRRSFATTTANCAAGNPTREPTGIRKPAPQYSRTSSITDLEQEQVNRTGELTDILVAGANPIEDGDLFFDEASMRADQAPVGSLVQTTIFGRKQQGVVYAIRPGMLYCCNLHGQASICKSMKLDFVFPQFAEQHIPEWKPPQGDPNRFLQNPEVSAPILSETDIDAAKAVFINGDSLMHKNVLKYDQAYQKLHIEQGMETITTTELASFVFETEEPSLMERFASHVYMYGRQGSKYFTQVEKVEGKTFKFRSQDEVRLINVVTERVRLRHPSYLNFIDKCQKIMDIADSLIKDVSQVYLEDHLPKQSTVPKFDDSDREFLAALMLYISHSEFPVSFVPFDNVIPAMLKPLHRFEELDTFSAVGFLKLIGVIPPWQDWKTFFQSVIIEDELGDSIAVKWLKCKATIEATTTAANKLEGKAKTQVDPKGKGQEKVLSPQIVNELELDADGFYARDMCDTIRHDFGNLEAIAIDDPSTKEVDDAVSLEMNSATGERWFHIHVADPTAFLPPGHHISLKAAERATSLYLAEESHAMLPLVLAKGRLGLNGGGAGVDSNGKMLDYAVTTSIRLGLDGELLEIKIRPSIVRNVIRLAYDDVDVVLGANPALTPEIYSWPLKKEAPLTRRPVSDEAKRYAPMLRAMFNETQMILRNRIQQGAFTLRKPEREVRVSANNLPRMPKHLEGPIFYTQKTDLQMRVYQSSMLSCSPSRSMVAEMMILTGRATAEYFARNGIPAMYRSQAPPAFLEQSPLELAPEERSFQEAYNFRSIIDGSLPMVDSNRGFLPISVMSPIPNLHWSLGLKNGYLKATSPLRRFEDLEVHWQLKSHFLGRRPTFTQLELISSEENRRIRTINCRKASLLSQQYWTLELFRRLQAEGALDRTFQARIIRECEALSIPTVHKVYRVNLVKFGMDMDCNVPPELEEHVLKHAGNFLVKPIEISPDLYTMKVAAVLE